jgi:glycosyltransferase involved in cell wall biosynthesis
VRITEAEISVVIPVRNGILFLERAFNSIRAISQQIQIVLVENGSTDGTLSLCNRLADSNTQVIHLETSGVSNARNIGIAAANGSVISLLDVDDEILKDRIEFIISREWDDDDFIVGTMDSIKSETANFPEEIKLAILTGKPMYCAIAVAFTKKGFSRLKGFDEKISHGEDIDLIMRAKRHGFQVMYTETPFLIRHFHSQNVSHDKSALITGLFSALRANIESSRSDNPSIKILHVMPNYFPHNGGIETLMTHYFNQQAAEYKFSHSIVTLNRENDLSAQITKGVDKVYEIAISYPKIQENVVHSTLLIMKQLREIIEKENPKLLHLHAIHELSYFTLKYARSLGIPVIFHFHGNLTEKDYKIIKSVSPLMKHALAVSEATRISLTKFLPSSALLHVIQNGVNDQEDIPKGGDKSAVPQLLLAGRIESEKGFDVAVEALALIKKDIPTVKLVILGNGSQLKNLIGLSERLGLTESVEFIGSIPNEGVIKYIDESWIVLVPSRDIEGFGIIAVEAALREVPVIASAVGGLIETIEDGKSGFLVPSESPPALAKKVVQLLRDSEQLVEIGVYARKRALALYGIKKFAKELEEYYFSVLNEERSNE